jgi:tripartite-type tricarboxylate transporter receptor subunit TctC
MRHHLLYSALIGALSLTAMAPACAQGAWPNRPVKLIVHAPPGGGADAYARIVADGLKDKWGQPVVVDNKSGANGLIASQALIAAPPDGYTLMQTATGPIAMNPLMHGKAYDPAVAYTAIAATASTYMIVVAGNDQPYSDLKSLIAYSKANPEKVTYATAGVGAVPHIGTEYINVALGGAMTHIPFRGEAQFITELLAGRVAMAMMISGTALPYVKSGKLKAITVTSAERSPDLPDVKTMREQGMNVSLPLWFGFIAPAGLPAELTRKINADVNAVLKSPAVQKRFAELQVSVAKPGTPEEFQAYLVEEAGKWATIVKESKISLKAD